MGISYVVMLIFQLFAEHLLDVIRSKFGIYVTNSPREPNKRYVITDGIM